MKYQSIHSPFGDLTLVEDEGTIIRLDWFWSNQQDQSPLLDTATRQLSEYAAGTRQTFDLPLNPRGSPFQRDVCQMMSAIPFGNTRTYGEIAKTLGASAQAVGRACGSNPIAIIIPCHRVMGAKGLTGFSGKGGIETKVALLRHEGAANLLI